MSHVIHHGPTTGRQALRALARYPDRIAFSWDGGEMTYRAALDLIGRMQAIFTRGGFGRHSRVAILTSNRAEAWCASVAASLVPMSMTWLHPLASLDDQLGQIVDGECDCVLIDAVGFLARGGELAAKLSHLKFFTLGKAEYGVDLMAAAESAGAQRAQNFARPDDISILNYTGGTTGKSKGALRTHAQNATYATAILADFEIPVDPHYLVIAPISHVTGTKILPVLMCGGSVRLMKGFDPAAVLATIAREKINMTLLVPTMIYVLLDHPDLSRTDLSSLDLLLYGASPMSPARLEEGLERIGPVFSQLYGQTECYPISVLRKADHDRARPELFESCGAPISSVDVAILDDDDREVEQGQSGEICVRAAHAVTTYWKQPELTKELFRGGWLHTGDIARLDERGYMFILDRKKDMVVSGGFNIYPREVEDALATHAGVAMSGVIGTPDEKWGEAVMAFVVRKEGANPDPQELIQLVKDKKGAAHAPKRIEFVDALPLTPVGKIDKKALRAQFWGGRDRQVG